MKVIRFPNSPFELHQPFEAAGDQPQAIKELVEGIEDGLTAQTAVAIAGGFTARANDGQVEVTRRLNGKSYTGLVPLSAAIRPGDVLRVPLRLF